MKFVSTAFLAAGLAALSACGGGAETNVVANDANTAYEVVPEDLNLLGNDVLLDNALGDLNAVDANAAGANSTTNGL